MRRKTKTETKSIERKKVMLVEDSPAERNHIALMIRDVYPHVDIFQYSSGFEALRFIRDRKYDLIVTDINIPDLSGFELIKFIKQEPTNKSTSIIVVSVESSKEDIQRAVNLGADEYIVKPVYEDRFKMIVSKYLL